MKKEIFLLITDLREKTIGKKKYFMRREVLKKRTQYCIRDDKFREIYKNDTRLFVERYWEQYFPLLENPYHPYKCGDIVYEVRGKSKEDYSVYQVVKTTKTKVYLRKILVNYQRNHLLERDFIFPINDCFEGEDIIEKQIEIVNKDEYVKLEYGIRSEQGKFNKLKDDKIWVGLDR